MGCPLHVETRPLQFLVRRKYLLHSEASYFIVFGQFEVGVKLGNRIFVRSFTEHAVRGIFFDAETFLLFRETYLDFDRAEVGTSFELKHPLHELEDFEELHALGQVWVVPLDEFGEDLI